MTSQGTASAQESTAPSQTRRSFSGDVLKLVSGTTIAQLLGILTSPLLTRLYAPEAFGVLALFTSVVSILGVITCLRYELAIMLPESDGEAANLLSVSLISAALISLLTIPIVWWVGEPLLRWLNAPQLGPYLWLVPPAVLVAGFTLALNYWNSRTRHFGRLSLARVSGSVTNTSTNLGLGYMGFATGGTLIGASVAGQAVNMTILGGQSWRDDRSVFFRSITWRKMLHGIKRYRKFPLYGTWTALLNTISRQLPAFMLAAFFSSSVVGYYALGFRILQMPMGLIGNAIGQVFFQRAAEAKVEGTLASLVEETFRRLVNIGLFPMLMLTIIGRDLYMVVFGQNWAEAGIYTQILSIWAFFWFVSAPMSILFSVLEKQEFGLKWNILLFFTRLLTLSVGGYVGNPRLALALLSITGTITYGYLSFEIMAASGVTWNRIWSILGTGFLYFAPFGAIMMILLIVGIESWLLVLTASILCGFYLLLLLRREPDLFRMSG